MSEHEIFVGTYTANSAPAGEGKGVYHLVVDDEKHTISQPRLVAEIESGSWITRVGDVLWSVREEEQGTVAAFDIKDDGTLRAIPGADFSTGAGSPCHLAVTPNGRHLIASSYGDGVVSDIALTADGKPEVDADGRVSLAVHHHEGSGPNKDRQTSPHAHSAWIAPGGKHVLVADLGTDELRRYAISESGTGGLEEDGIAAKLPGGAGPRHLAVSSTGFIYVTGELDNSVHILRWNDVDATADYLGSLPVGEPQNIAGRTDAFPGHLELSADETRLWVANRGPNIIATFAVEDGNLHHLADVQVGGENPRHFTRVGNCLVVGHQNTNTLALLPLDDNGIAQAPATVIEMGSPVCILPL